jgi:hypothetical protein
MGNRISSVSTHLPRGLILSSLVLCVGLISTGCGADEGAKVDSASSQPIPDAVKGMRENLKQKAAMQKGAPGKQQRSAPAGK